MKLHGFAVAGKSWVALVGSLLTFIVPWIVQYSAFLPAPWPSVIAAAVAIATAVGVYHAPYQPVPTAQTDTGKHSSNSPWPE